MAQKKSSKPWAQRSRKAKEAFAQSLLSLSSQLTGIFVTATAGGALIVLYKGASLHDIWIGIKQMMAIEIVLMLVVLAIFMLPRNFVHMQWIYWMKLNWMLQRAD